MNLIKIYEQVFNLEFILIVISEGTVKKKMIFSKNNLKKEENILNTLWIIDGMIVISVKMKPFELQT